MIDETIGRSRRRRRSIGPTATPPPVDVSKSIAIVQSSYIPWKGYFDLINAVDEFVLYDDAQYTRRDWRNRNRIKSRTGTEWLTIPVRVKGRFEQRIDETEISDPRWARRHWLSLVHTYGAFPHFDRYASSLEALYGASDADSSAPSTGASRGDCVQLGIDTAISWSSDYEVEGTKSERLVNLCLATGATSYFSGPRLAPTSTRPCSGSTGSTSRMPTIPAIRSTSRSIHRSATR